MLDRADYRRGWEWKKKSYEENGFSEGASLFTSTEGPGLDMVAIEQVADSIESLLT
jgi:hypothetical protein